MPTTEPPEILCDALRRLAGYLNFASGTSDASTRKAWNLVYDAATQGDPLSGLPAWLVVQDWLSNTVTRLAKEQSAFRDAHQATRVIKLLWSDLLPEYLDFHRDLLFHQEPELIFNGFFMSRAADAILSVGIDGDDKSIVASAIDRLDDFVGYRPIAMLENRQCHPYRHEFICPVPLYMAGAGVSAGPYREIIQLAIEALNSTDPSVLRAASFDPNRMLELSLDPRAYDFDHPVNRRPNYHFGGWDERSIDGDGYYDRFIVRQVTLDALLHRLADEPDANRDELMAEAATVLAGTILMASGISGWGPGAYTSDITLGSLMKPIAAYRDDYYAGRLSQIKGKHGKRLAEEQQLRRQPFGAVRQHLNAALAERRAAQLQHVGLARLYARMGYPDAAKRQTDTVAAASARMMCRIDCLMTLGLRQLRAGELTEAVKIPEITFDMIKRGIDCGALIDPWDILGFGANFSLYPGPESGVHDSRVDNLIYLTEQLFGYIARVWSEAAAQNNEVVFDQMERCYREIAEWWRSYAAHTVDSIDATDPLESYDSAKLVAQALRLWHKGGAAAGDVKFWAPHADLFDSPRAYSLVIQALLEREDFVPAMALLVHWLSNVDQVGLRSGASSLPRLSERWLLKLRSSTITKRAYGEPSIDQIDSGDTAGVWPLVRKFFDYLEANAEEYWSAPRFSLGKTKPRRRDWDVELTAMEGDDAEEDGLFDAAYEGMTYRDTTDDGIDGAIHEFGDESSGDELEAETKRLVEHLDFLQSLARMWSVAADVAVTDHNSDDLKRRWESLQGWAKRARENRVGLLEMLDAVRGFSIAPAGSDKDSMRSYDRRRVLRDSLMERIIGTAVEMSDARRLISGAISAIADGADLTCDNPDEAMAADDAQAVHMYAALIASDQAKAQALFPNFVEAIRDKNLLYIPLSRGGDPVKIYVARLRQRVLRHLMHWLPRRGLITETCRLIETAREMEQQNPIGVGAVTEFDGLFQTGFRSLVASLVESTRHSVDGAEQKSKQSEREIAETLIPLLERLTETMLASWLAHSQTLRLSPLESVADARKWESLVAFIKKYGDPIFTQTFLQLGNVRAILHQGVGAWLQRALEEGETHFSETQLFKDLENGVVQIKDVERPITLVYETLIDHHAEYLDYNSTTTQSDRGDLVYMFLDFLRLRVRYERIAWNLKPVMWAHEVLVRSGLDDAAVLWRESLNDRIGSEADIYISKMRQLQQTYAMRMPTVADRISERFVQPMTIDRMRALVGPAMHEAELGESNGAFELLEQETELLTRHPTGVGLDVPAWLNSLEEEVEQLAKRNACSEIDPQSLVTIAIVPVTIDQLNEQLNAAKNQGRRLPHMK
ncbi:hypothetical protein [Rubripirellula reticaptiva]|uniref:Uncharacterized protein n=1 Tax=Rubripirellula reticaptiva TaxID=2528013 RepID=A0A5C6F3P2_9BACT|nr:hypothetical protein [Rubripirellula reticaptiva]TWU55755.1 hypothetical protein Poly59_20560 [Rubripirellula reticaptiva]